MRFLEYETWKLKKDCKMADYDKLIENWFKYVAAKKKELFEEWVSAKYYCKTDAAGNPTGEYIMLFEYDSLDGHHAYKTRRDTKSEYDEYNANDPYQCFELDSVNVIYMQPLMTDIWFDYTDEKRNLEKANGVHLQHFLEYETWKVRDGVDEKEYSDSLATWFKYVVATKQRLFDEWVSGRYYRQTDRDGNPTGVYAMIFEYDSFEGHHAYKYRRWHSTALNDGAYTTYVNNDPYNLFDMNTVHTDYMKELKTDLWFNYDEEKKAEGK